MSAVAVVVLALSSTCSLCAKTVNLTLPTPGNLSVVGVWTLEGGEACTAGDLAEGDTLSVNTGGINGGDVYFEDLTTPRLAKFCYNGTGR